ncbi:MAG: glycosyltransferase, partial [Luteitalea sp.]|nr:glycosyltransferase [Luteitalea sp.]
GDTPSRKAHDFLERGDGRAPHDINIVCVNADRTPLFVADAGREFLQGRHTVGLWFWELEQFPDVMHHGFDYVDEVWAASDFVAEAIRAVGRRPVYTVPLPVPIPQYSPGVTRESLGIPASFLFLFMFDFFSVMERKNPMGVIRAFERAFQPGEGPTLVLKTINGDSRLNDLEKLREAAVHRPDVLILDGYYSAEQKNALLGLCNCYVSLHRSEGLGLTMAEAMGLGKPVIATGYSGNLHFMTPDNSYMVDYARVHVGAECDPYPAHCFWAEPDLDQAARLMRRVYEAQDEAALKGRQARLDILTRHNLESSASAVRRRVEEIRRTGARAAASHPASAATIGAHESAQQQWSPVIPLEHLAGVLTPTPSVAPGRRLRGPLLQAQVWLFKLLRPYWWQQRFIHASLLQAIRETQDMAVRAVRAEATQGAALRAVWDAVHALRSDIAPPGQIVVGDRVTELADSPGSLRGATITPQASAGNHLETSPGRDETLQSVGIALETLRSELAAVKQLDLSERVTTVEAEVSTLREAAAQVQGNAGKRPLPDGARIDALDSVWEAIQALHFEIASLKQLDIARQEDDLKPRSEEHDRAGG